ncbi:MAG: HAD family hydrolase [Beduini sp.]|uniref:HAD family hydrolase n=1 Tax=Beduini sp. TaxID=1922300 RepID=UPI0011CB4DC1
MIKNIVFDMGNVVLSYDPNYIIQHFTKDKDQQRLLVEAIFKSPEWLALDEGTLSKEDACAIMKARVDLQLKPLVKKVMDEWYLYLTPFKNIIELSKRLKEEGYTLYLLSNTSLSFYEYYENVEAFAYFKDFYISAKHLLMKPEPAIFKDFCKKMNLNPVECFFIDDSQDNINSAKSIGMQGICFNGNYDNAQMIYDAIKKCS